MKYDEYVIELKKHNEKTDGEYDSTIELFEELKEIQEFFEKK